MYKLFSFLFLIPFISISQNSSKKLHSVINNSKTSKHIKIPGTKIFMIIPKGGIVKTNLIQVPDNHYYYRVSNALGQYYDENKVMRNSVATIKLGYEVLDTLALTVNGYPAVFLHSKMDSTLEIYDLIFGAGNFSGIITVTITNPKKNSNIGDDIIESFNSIYYDEQKKYIPFEANGFMINDSLSIFKLSNFHDYECQKEYRYLIKGLDNNQDIKFAEVVVKEENPYESDSGSLTRFSERVLQPLKRNNNFKVESNFTIIGNHYTAYKTVVTGKLKDTEVIMKQYCIKNKYSFITLEFSSRKSENTENYLIEFEKLVNTIDLK